jgi:hypothetical protein
MLSFLEAIGPRLPTANHTEIFVFTVDGPCRSYISARSVSVANLICREFIQSERKMHDQTCVSKCTLQCKKKYYIIIDLLKHGYRATVSWKLQKMLKVSPWVSMQALQETGFLGPAFFHYVWLGLCTTISYETSLQSCCKMWIWRLGFRHDGAAPHCLLALRQILNNVFPEQWIGQSGQQHGRILPII